MSTHRVVLVNCSECGIGTEYDFWSGIGGANGTAQDARANAKELGWAVGLPGGRDLCPDCISRVPGSAE